MVRNEADLIEAFVRHHVERVDALYLVDHRSEDGTRDILRALVAEGLPLSVQLDDHPAQRQAEIVTALARQAFASGADVVFPLDANEFLKLPDRAVFERWLARVPPALAALGHLPVRSLAQLRAKIALGWRAHHAAAHADPTLAFHWRELYAELGTGDPSPARLRDIACNYGLPMARWQPAAGVALVDDPLPMQPTDRYGALARPLRVTF